MARALAGKPRQEETLPLVAEDEDEDSSLLESESEDEDEAEWRRAAGLAEREEKERKKHRKGKRGLSKDGNRVEMEKESINICGWCGGFLFVIGIGLVVWALMQQNEHGAFISMQNDDRISGKTIVFMAAGCAYFLYLCEALCCSKTSQYLRNICCEASFIKFVAKVQESNPEVGFSIQNWHNETRTSTDSEGRTTTSTVRVNTHFAAEGFAIQGHTDETLSPEQMIAMFHLLHGSGSIADTSAGDVNFTVSKTGEQVLILLCHFPMDFRPREQHTLNSHAATRASFYARNTSDVYQDKAESQKIDFPGYVERMMLVISTSGSDSVSHPWWMNFYFYAFLSMLGLSIPYRLFFFHKTAARTWGVVKHFSALPPSGWQGDPMSSLKNDPNPVVAQIHKAGKQLKVQKSEGHGDQQGDSDDYEHYAYHHQSGKHMVVNDDVPEYWTNQNVKTSFDTKEKVSSAFNRKIGKILADTFKAKATRDRKKDDPMPNSLKVVGITRMEDRDMWVKYAHKRHELAELRDSFTAIKDLKGSGRVKTMNAMGKEDGLYEDMNEVYLFHGTSPSGAMGISGDGFKLSFVGSNVGTMFGRGVYLAEQSSKCDEYAQTDDSGAYAGIYAALLCRVTLGEAFRIDKSNIPAIEKAMASGEYDCVLGDREEAVGTYREFVVFDEAQIYPEYVVLYRRVFD